MTATALLVALAVASALVAISAWSLHRSPYARWNLALITLTGLALLDVIWIGALLVLGATAASTVTAVLVVAGVATATLALTVNGVVMLRKEGRTLANLLSLLLAAGFAGMGVLLWVALHWHIAWLAALCGPLLVITAYVIVTLVGFVVYGALVTTLRPRGTVSAVIVLGSGLIGARVPPLLAGRLEAGAKAWRRAHTRAGTPPLLIPSGGQGADEERAEGDAMADHLRENHPETAASIRVEDRARTTRENLLFSRALVETENPSFIVATSDYHVLRAGRLTHELGMDARVVGSRTARYYLPSAMLREYAATVQAGRLTHALLLGSMVAAVIVSLAQEHI